MLPRCPSLASDDATTRQGEGWRHNIRSREEDMPGNNRSHACLDHTLAQHHPLHLYSVGRAPRRRGPHEILCRREYLTTTENNACSPWPPQLTLSHELWSTHSLSRREDKVAELLLDKSDQGRAIRGTSLGVEDSIVFMQFSRCVRAHGRRREVGQRFTGTRRLGW